jgi:hypothetical protein
MVTSNKILTVSYGTFSCTLEGFDESFETMKAIAEYFRDLAADDRYFGAEPPQPDAEMLARIAQREIERRVEARQEGAAIHLRAAAPALAGSVAAGAASEPVQAPPEAAPQAADMESATRADTTAGNQADEAGQTPDAQTSAVDKAEETAQDRAEQDQADPAEAMQETRAQPEPDAQPVEEGKPVGEAAQPGVDIGTQSVPEAAPETLEDRKTAPDTAPEAETKSEAVVEAEATFEPEAEPEPVAEAEREPAEEAEPELRTEPGAAELAPIPEAEPVDEIEPAQADSIAAKLARIRAVVARKGAEDEDYVEDQHAGGFVAAQSADIEDAMEDTARAEDIAAAMAETAALDTDAMETALDEAHRDAEPVADVEGTDTLFADLDADDLDEDPDGDHENLLADTAAEAPARSRARVLKVKRAELEQALASGMIEEVEDEDEDASDAETLLSPEDEADLLRELAEVEAEIEAGAVPAVETVAQPVDASEPVTHAPDAAERPVLAPRVDDEGADVSRLMEAASDKLDDPEAASTRETYSHMRAAVAATRARIDEGHDPKAEAGDSAYRADLADVVRPRRPEAQGRSRPRPSARPASPVAPLKLVAEQRIDEAPRGPVRPRRVAKSEPEPVETGGEGFSEFAREMGAVELPELLEAAAAYLSFVEGRDQFSRPQLMTKVRQSGAPDFNREDGLRSFGQLLREGKIEKTGAGRFTAADGIGFRPDTRAAG